MLSARVLHESAKCDSQERSAAVLLHLNSGRKIFSKQTHVAVNTKKGQELCKHAQACKHSPCSSTYVALASTQNSEGKPNNLLKTRAELGVGGKVGVVKNYAP